MEDWLSNVPLEEDYDDRFYSVRDFREDIKEWCESCPKLLGWTKDIYHCKFGICTYDGNPKEDYKQVLEIYDSIKHTDISTRLIHHEIIYNIYPIFVYILVTEKYGKDLRELFMDERAEHNAKSSDELLNSTILFNQVFPKDKIPNKILLQIKDVLQRFQDIGYIHNDIWCPNILLKDGKVKLIDFEYCDKLK